MADVHNKEQRSYNMSRIRSAHTKPEMLVRKFLHSKGFRYKPCYTKLAASYPYAVAFSDIIVYTSPEAITYKPGTASPEQHTGAKKAIPAATAFL
jgi:hypothetical protein